MLFIRLAVCESSHVCDSTKKFEYRLLRHPEECNHRLAGQRAEIPRSISDCGPNFGLIVRLDGRPRTDDQQLGIACSPSQALLPVTFVPLPQMRLDRFAQSCALGLSESFLKDVIDRALHGAAPIYPTPASGELGQVKQERYTRGSEEGAKPEAGSGLTGSRLYK